MKRVVSDITLQCCPNNSVLTDLLHPKCHSSTKSHLFSQFIYFFLQISQIHFVMVSVQVYKITFMAVCLLIFKINISIFGSNLLPFVLCNSTVFWRLLE